MAASLIVAGYEMLGGTTNPEYRLAPGFDFGAGEPDQTTISSLYLDGDTVSGDRTRNRTISLPITVRGSNPQVVAQNVSTLLQAISATTFTMQWTPDGGLPLIFDCYRAVWSRPERSLVKDAQGLTNLLLTFQAKPFGRSPVAQTLTVPDSSLQVDSFDTAPTGATLNTTTKYEGTGSAQVAFTFGSGPPAGSTSSTVSRTFASKNLSTYTNVSFRLWVTSPITGWPNTALTLTLSSTGGSTTYPAATMKLLANRWNVLAVPLTGGTVTSGTGVNLAAVTGYSFSVFAPLDVSSTTMLADDMRAATAIVQTTTTHGTQALLPLTVGSARAPINLTLSNGSTYAAFLLHSPPDDQDSNLSILNSLSGSSTDQTVSLAALNAVFNGTYTVLLGVGAFGSGSVTATVTISQIAGSTTVASTVLTKTYTSGNSLIPVGIVTLPLLATPPDNTDAHYTIRVQITGTDRYTEIMLLDTTGQTVFTDTNMANPAANTYIDEPTALQSSPSVYAGATRSAAVGALGNQAMSGGPILFEPGTNKILAWVATSTPTVSATYYPRWIDERAV